MKQRVAARLLLASCTLALGLGLGTAIAVTGVLGLQHPSLRVPSPGQAEGELDRGVHQLFVDRAAPGGGPPLAGSRPSCTVTDGSDAATAMTVPTETGFAAVRVDRDGRHRVACSSTIPLTVLVRHRGEGLAAYLAAVGRGLLLAVALTVLAAIWAARALLTVRRLRSAAPA